MPVCLVLLLDLMCVCVHDSVNNGNKRCLASTRQIELTEPNDHPKFLFHVTIPQLDLEAVTIN